MRKILSPLIILLTTMVSYSQVQEVWSVPLNYAVGSRDFATVNAVDADGNVYVAGANYAESGDFITIIKYDKNGAEKWKHTYGSDADENTRIRPVAIVLHDNHVYIAATSDYFLYGFITMKYSINGTNRWIKRFEGFPDERVGPHATDIGVDDNGNVYVTGYAVFALFGSDDSFKIGDYLTIKYDAAGDQQWLKRYNGAAPGNGLNIATSIAVEPSGNVYITGTSQLNGQMDIVTVKYSAAGSELWAQRHASDDDGTDGANDIILDAGNNVLVTGYAETSTEFDYEMTTIKYNSTGDQLWLRKNASGAAKAISVDGGGNIYVTGSTLGQYADYKTIKYSPDGTQQWIKTHSNSVASYDIATAIAFDVDNNVYITGIADNNIVTIKYKGDGALQWQKTVENVHADVNAIIIVNGFGYLFDGSFNISLGVDAAYNVYVSGGGWDPSLANDHNDFITIRYSQCNIICPSNITVNNDQGKCDAVVNFTPATYTGDCGSSFTYSHNTGIAFPIGTTIVTATSDETGASCTFTITVVDNEKPVITNCPSNKTVNTNAGVCYASAASVNAGVAAATDNCNPVGVTGVRSDGASLSANYPVGVTTILWTATDPSNNTATCSQTIAVVDNVPPTISGESASTYVLSPPNHTMRDVTINYTATDNCAVTSVITVTSNEPINGVGDGDTDPDWLITDNHHVKLRAERSANGTGRIYTITITAIDPSGNTATKTIEVRIPHNIKNPHSGRAYIVGSTVPFEGEFWDKPGKTHTAKWLIDDNTIAKAIVTEPSGIKNGKVTGSYKFTAPGVYKLQMNVTDQNGVTHFANTAGDLEAIVVIYDPNGGHTYGGGYYHSPAGALRSNPSATGKASYGFAMNYFKNSTYPKGETQFEFKVGSFEFNALNFEYLVISNSMSQFKGTGKIIGGQSGVAFTMTVTDGQLDGSGVDKIRMKIYNKNNGSIIYDNQPGASDAALPTQAVGANSMVVISGTNSGLTSANTTQKGEMETKVAERSNDLDVIAFPNPSTTNFSITVKANSEKEKIAMQVLDMYGRIIETRNVNANSITRFGERYRPGTYFVKIINGKEYKIIKLVKLSD